MIRKEARELAFSMLFEYGFDMELSPIAHYERAIESRDDVADDAYVRSVLTGFDANRQVIDGAIEQYAVNWKKERISHVAMAILRLATYEMLYMEDIPLRVSLNEAVELSKKYDDEKAYGFVNGVLNAMMHDDRVVGEK
jgi:N utilization substance protein B